MAEIKRLDAIEEKWTRVTPGRVADYTLGIKNPKRDWETEAKAAKAIWKLGIDAAHAKDLYGKGIDKAGTKKWQDRSLKKGPGRFAEGVFIAGPDYAKGFAPYHAAIERVTLPPKFPRGDLRNYERSKAIGVALHEEKVGA